MPPWPGDTVSKGARMADDMALPTLFDPPTKPPAMRMGAEPTAEGHPSARAFPAHRRAEVDGQAHSIDAAADRLAVDPRFTQVVDRYLGARRRLRLDRAGWRAAFRRDA